MCGPTVRGGSEPQFELCGLVQQLGLVSAPKVASTREPELVDAREVTHDHATDARRS
jgi:hypothetical protein